MWYILLGWTIIGLKYCASVYMMSRESPHPNPPLPWLILIYVITFIGAPFFILYDGYTAFIKN